MKFGISILLLSLVGMIMLANAQSYDEVSQGCKKECADSGPYCFSLEGSILLDGSEADNGVVGLFASVIKSTANEFEVTLVGHFHANGWIGIAFSTADNIMATGTFAFICSGNDVYKYNIGPSSKRGDFALDDANKDKYISGGTATSDGNRLLCKFTLKSSADFELTANPPLYTIGLAGNREKGLADGQFPQHDGKIPPSEVYTNGKTKTKLDFWSQMKPGGVTDTDPDNGGLPSTGSTTVIAPTLIIGLVMLLWCTT